MIFVNIHFIVNIQLLLFPLIIKLQLFKLLDILFHPLCTRNAYGDCQQGRIGSSLIYSMLLFILSHFREKKTCLAHLFLFLCRYSIIVNLY